MPSQRYSFYRNSRFFANFIFGFRCYPQRCICHKRLEDMHMKTKKDFLMQLKHSMACRFSLREIRDTLEDFNGFFEDGLQEGKTEEDLCLSFGTPREIVQKMSSEKRKLPLHMLFALLASAVCLACIAGMAPAFRFQHMPRLFFCIPVLAVSIALLSLEGGILFEMAVSFTPSAHRAIPLRFCMLMLMGSLALFSTKGLSWIIDIAAPASAGQIAGNICKIFLLCGIALFLLGSYSFFHGNAFSFGTAIQGMGILCSACAALDFLHRLDALPFAALSPLLPCACSLLLSLCYDGMLLFAKHAKKRP